MLAKLWKTKIISLCINILNALHMLLVHQINRRTLQFTDVNTISSERPCILPYISRPMSVPRSNLGLTIKSFFHYATEETLIWPSPKFAKHLTTLDVKFL